VIRELGRNGVTVFLNSHLLAEVEAVCGEIAIMFRGRVLRQGPVSQITEEMSMRDGRMHLRFRTSALPEQLPKELEGATRTEHGCEVAVADREAVPGLIDVLCDAGVKIYEVEQYHASLEEAFLRAMDDADAHGVGGQQ
jgi:ABC-2 type transport system ATP-binding protein